MIVLIGYPVGKQATSGYQESKIFLNETEE